MSPPAMPLQAMTFGEMHAKRWTLRSQCTRCGVVMRVNLKAAIQVAGPDAIPWGRHPPCPIISDNRFPCEGRLTYLARTILGGTWKPMLAPSRRELEAWRHNRDNAAYNVYRGREPRTGE